MKKTILFVLFGLLSMTSVNAQKTYETMKGEYLKFDEQTCTLDKGYHIVEAKNDTTLIGKTKVQCGNAEAIEFDLITSPTVSAKAPKSSYEGDLKAFVDINSNPTIKYAEMEKEAPYGLVNDLKWSYNPTSMKLEIIYLNMSKPIDILKIYTNVGDMIEENIKPYEQVTLSTDVSYKNSRKELKIIEIVMECNNGKTYRFKTRKIKFSNELKKF